MSDMLDADYQKVAAIKFLLGSPGWKYYKELVDILITQNEYDTDKLTGGVLTSEKLQEINFCLGKKKAYSSISLLEAQMLDEAEEEISPSPA